ncbi:MAG TPA: DNA/RNA helicase domain-containing protein, partial [Terriglobales bacterium]|nr:DNA/RNA helicase domain-containing protein [Terriglobales bacterium]
MIERQGVQELHPSDQVRGYVEYCRQFHSAVAENRATVHGCVLFTGDRWAGAYVKPPNDELVSRYPLFTAAPDDVNRRFPDFFRTLLSVPHERFARAFANGRYRQDRGFVAQIGAQILKPHTKVFELLDRQRSAFSLCRAIVSEVLATRSDAAVPKRVVIIKGPPGSGKSVIAARLWAALVTDESVPKGDVVFTTTSMSQSSNWSDLFGRATAMAGGAGVVRKATSDSPVSTQRVGQLRKQLGPEFLSDFRAWPQNLRELQALGEPYHDGARDNQNLVSIVDEAHGLINPEYPRGRGNVGFAPTLGPQAYHIIRSSVISVFLLDPLQGFRERENTTIEELRAWSKELGAGDPVELSLEGAQFRCAGSSDYVTWLESLLGGADSKTNNILASAWYRSMSNPSDVERSRVRSLASTLVSPIRNDRNASSSAGFDFRVFDSPETWEQQLRQRFAEGSSVRILSTYSRKWKTENVASPHELPPSSMDFHEPYQVGRQTRHWSRIWNFVHRGTDYTWFVTGHPAGRIANDPLCEVGCPYAVRGFDYDYVGVLWLND